METPITDPYVGTWKINSWKPDEQKYEGLFPSECRLTMSPTLQLTWTSDASHEISFRAPFPHGGPITAETCFEGFSCSVKLTLTTGNKLIGAISLSNPPAQTGPAGTFIADASNGTEEKGLRRYPRWRRWLRRLVHRLDESLPDERRAA